MASFKITPFFDAVRENDLKTVKEYLQHRPDFLNAKEKGSVSLPIEEAAMGGHFEVLSYLIEQGSPMPPDLLYWGIKGKSIHTVELLLQKGLPAHHFSGYLNPLHLAVRQASPELFACLLAYGVDPLTLTGQHQTLLHSFNANHPEESMEILHEALQRGVNPNHLDQHGQSPLHLMAHGGSLEGVQMLLQHQANLHERTPLGETPLHIAAQQGHLRIVKFLLSFGADPTAQNYRGLTPLELAAESENRFRSNPSRDMSGTISYLRSAELAIKEQSFLNQSMAPLINSNRSDDCQEPNALHKARKIL